MVYTLFQWVINLLIWPGYKLGFVPSFHIPVYRPVLGTGRYSFYSSHRGRPFDYWGGSGLRSDFRKKNIRQADFEGKIPARKYLGLEKIPTLEKISFMEYNGVKTSYIVVCQEKNLSSEVWEKKNSVPKPNHPAHSPPPLPSLQIQMLGSLVKLHLRRFIPGDGKCNSYRCNRGDRDDRGNRGEKGDRGNRGDSRGIKPHHCFVMITNIDRISSQQ